jgi:putative transposase
MEFIKDNIYHIYNQGNNRHKVFYNRENYGFFLQKMNDYLLPYCDIMAWCLMPNHFHWMVYVRETEIDRVTSTSRGDTAIDRVTSKSRGATLSRTPTSSNLNQAIGIMLSSYTRAINIQQNRSGSLFRQHTKAESITKPQEVSPSYYNMGFGTLIYIPDPEKEYPQICFDYIHNNPVKAGLVKCPEDWEFSSFRDLCGLRGGKLVCRQRVEQFELNF